MKKFISRLAIQVIISIIFLPFGAVILLLQFVSMTAFLIYALFYGVLFIFKEVFRRNLFMLFRHKYNY